MRIPAYIAVALFPFAALAADPSPPGTNDFTGMDLEALMQVKVPTVYGASKHDQKITEAPAAVTIVTAQDIEEYGHRTLADILDGVRGLYTTSDRGYYFLGVRGVDRLGDFGGRSLITINGHRINDPIYESALLGHDFPLDVDLIERVEVIRGPGSALYGNNAFFDVINIVTRQGRDFDGHGVEVSTSYGSFDSFSGRFSYGNRSTNGVELLVSGNYYGSSGNPQLVYPAAPSGFPGAVQQGHDGETAQNFFASISDHGFTLEALYGRRDKDLANGPYGSVFNDPRSKLRDERGYLEGRYESDIGQDWKLTARTYFDYYSYDGTYVYDYANNGVLTVNRDTPRAEWWGGELQFNGTLWEKHHLTLGLEGRNDIEQHQQNYDVEPAYTYIDESHTAYSLGAYAQDEYHVFNSVTLNLGVRFDHFSTVGDTANPRLGLIYQPQESTTLKALFGTAFRAPNAYEFDYHDAVYEANHNLKPETIRSYELVWEQALRRNYRFTGSLYYNDVDSLIGQQLDPANGMYSFQNIGAAHIMGAEAELEAKWESGIRARASYAFASAIDDVTGQGLENSPKHLAKIQLTLPLYPEKVFAGLELLGASGTTTGQGAHLPGRAVVNLNLFSQKLFRGLDFSASIDNLLDKRYYDPVAPDFSQDLIPQDGRTFRLKLTYRF